MTTIEVTETTLERLHELALAMGEPEHMIAEKAIEAYRRQHLLDTMNADFAALRKNPDAWRDYLAEVEEWDQTAHDGLETA
jgi:predicted transcriptional regulator